MFTLTVSHVFVALVAILVMDALASLLKDRWTDWWFAHSQFPLRLMVWGGILAVIVVAQVSFWLAVLLAVAVAMAIIGWVWWKKSGHAPAASTGKLQIEVHGLPFARKATITITGPGGYTKTLAYGATLSVAPGDYTIVAAPRTIGAQTYNATIVPVSPNNVAANATTHVHVNYV